MTESTPDAPRDNEIRAEAVREATRYLESIHKRGLRNRDDILADLDIVAFRMEQGMTARGNTRPTPAGESVTDEQLQVARFAYCSVYEAGARHKDALRAAIDAVLAAREVQGARIAPRAAAEALAQEMRKTTVTEDEALRGFQEFTRRAAGEGI